MRQSDKPFVCYRQGWLIRIVPRNGLGWRLFAMWMASMALLVGVFIAVLASEPGPGGEIAAVIGILVAVAIWVVAMIRWMMARSEIVHIQ